MSQFELTNPILATGDLLPKFVIVCRLNQARSVIASKYLSKVFPEAEFTSYGVVADIGKKIPSNVLKVARKWGLELEEFRSKPLQLEEEISSARSYYIFAEKEFEDSFRQRNWPSMGTQSFQTLNLPTELIAVDPAIPKNLIHSSLEIELAKSVLCSANAMYSFSLTEPLISKLYFPKNEMLIEKAHQEAVKSLTESEILLNIDFKFNGYSNVMRKSVKWDGTFANMSNVVLPTLSNGEVRSISPNSESTNPIEMLSSWDFIQSLKALREHYDIVATSSPSKVQVAQEVYTLLSMSLAKHLIEIY